MAKTVGVVRVTSSGGTLPEHSPVDGGDWNVVKGRDQGLGGVVRGWGQGQGVWRRTIRKTESYPPTQLHH